jgi:hypothetical protein
MHTLTALVLAAAALTAAGPAQEGKGPDLLKVDDFEGGTTQQGLPEDWQELHFEKIERHTSYTLKQEDDNSYLYAVAERSASGLIRRFSVDLREYPILRWRWRIDHVIARGDAATKAGDDYAARLYVNFKYDPDRVGVWTRIKYALARKKHGEYPPLHTVNYIWANKLKQGAIVPNAYTERAMMVAVQSGEGNAGRWVQEERNVLEDYREAFGEEPTEVVQVAVMTDTDNTRSSAVADYDDIYFARRAPAAEGESGSEGERLP